MTGLFCFDVAFIVLIPLIRDSHPTAEQCISIIINNNSIIDNIRGKNLVEDPDKSSMKEAENIPFYR